jgi:hypothetical protein
LKHLYGLLVFLAGLAGTAPASADSVPLTDGDIAKLFAGGLSFVSEGKTYDLRFVFTDDGDWTVSRPGADDNFGTWKISDGAVCLNVQGPILEWRGFHTRPRCRPVFRDGQTLYWTDQRERMRLENPTDLARIVDIPARPTQTAEAPSRSVSTPVDTATLRQEQEMLRQQAELERQRIEAQKRELEMMRLALEKERLQQQQRSLQQQQAAIPPTAVPVATQPDTIPPVIVTETSLETKSDRLALTGVVMDDRQLSRVEIDGKKVAVDTGNGGFSVEKTVAVGVNRFHLAAFDSAGNKSEQFVTVTRLRNIPDIAFGEFHALVIGIDEYESLPKLKTALSDARAVAEKLKVDYGYKVRLLENPTRDDIIDALDDYRDRLKEDDNLLIYYAGHGWLDKESNRGYWLPLGAKADRRSRWFSNASLTDALQAMQAKHVMVVADSCYSGTLTRSITVPPVRNPDYITRMAEKRTRVVLSSGGLEPVSDSGGGNHSVFAEQFLQALEENQGVLDGTQLFEHVRHRVVLNANQTPEYSDIRMAGHEGGDFLFVRRN